jgi:Ca2+:H+ antiporter
MLGAMSRAQRRLLLGCAGAVALAGSMEIIGAGPIPRFVVAAVALAAVAYVIGEATEQLGHHLGPAVTGIVQSAVGNVPELFVSVFALRAGLVTVVQSALIGSILSNALLVLGLVFLVGGARHGALRFESRTPRMIATLLTLVVAALVLPTMAHALYLPAAAHAQELALVCAVVLLLVAALSFRAMLSQGERVLADERSDGAPIWPLRLAVGVLLASGAATVFVSDWFVDALGPVIPALGISESFAGLVLVAAASNAVSKFVGIQLAVRGQAELAVSVVLNSALQVAIVLIPVVIAISFFLGGAPFTLAIPPILAAALVLSILIVTLVCVDGQADMVDGAALVGLYVIVAAIFWWD